MIIDTGTCKDCKEVFTISKKAMENWSELEFICPACGSINTSRKISNPCIDVALGIYGNGHTGFEKEFVYKQSTKYGTHKGTKVKKKWKNK